MCTSGTRRNSQPELAQKGVCPSGVGSLNSAGYLRMKLDSNLLTAIRVQVTVPLSWKFGYFGAGDVVSECVLNLVLDSIRSIIST